MKLDKLKLKTYCYVLVSVLFLTLSSACTDLDPINQRIDELETEVDELQKEFNELKSAWESYKVISDLQLLAENENNSGGWLLKFTDGSSISVMNGNDGHTPYIKIDGEGYWVVSYDGENFEYITNEYGVKVSAYGIDGEDGKDGKDGTNGWNGLCVRVVIDSNGYYVFEVYDPIEPATVIYSNSTPYTSNPSAVIAAIVKDDNSGKITITMADGSTFEFEMQKSFPTGIVVLTAENVMFKSVGESVSFEIRINPSNIYFNYNVESADCDLSLEYIDRETTYSSSLTLPVVLEQIVPTKDKDGELIEGQYTVILKDSGKNLLPYKEGVFLKLRYKDANQEIAYITSDVFIIEFVNTRGELLQTGLPVMMISTPYAINSKENWVDDCTIRIYEGGKISNLFSKVQMKGRGNSTWLYPKKPYAIKLDSKEEMLGMKKHKRWVLLANFLDRTLMRNAVAFEISKMTGLDYTPSGEYVEVIINGVHHGNYFLTEQIKVDKNRVDITELDENSVSGEALTGGYIMEMDSYFDEDYKFRSKYFDYPWMFKDPDVVNSAQQSYMEDYVARMEEEINKLPGKSDYQNYLDIDSAIDFWFVNELMMNAEISHTQSVYFTKDMNKLMKMGPVWDFDWGTLANLNPKNFTNHNGVYFKKLMQDQEFVSTLKSRWKMFYNNFLTIPDFIDEIKDYIAESQEINFKKWKTYEKPNYESTDFYEAVEKIKQCYLAKLKLMDEKIALL